MKRMRNFVPKHKKAVGRVVTGREKIARMYDSAWEKYRKRFLEINSRCYCCGNVATVVDHLVPHKGDEKLFKQLDNHIPLCEKHHNTVTALFDRRYIVGDSIRSKLEWMASQRIVNDPENKFGRVRVLPSYDEN